MKIFSVSSKALLIITVIFSCVGQGDGSLGVLEYTRSLPLWGATWAPGAGTTNGYFPSFYTGFAMRSEFPNRIHVRLGRGNQTRVSVVLDDQTLTDYLYDLVKRYDFYKKATAGAPGTKSAMLSLASNQAGKALPQLQYFNQVIESPTLGILTAVGKGRSGQLSSEETYTKALWTLRELNPGRVFFLNINLTQEFLKWKQLMQKNLAGEGNAADVFAKKPQSAVIAINSLLWGRINYVAKPSPEVNAKLAATAQMALENAADEKFLVAAVDLFKTLTGNKYAFKVVNKNGQWQSALQCADVSKCILSYPEFTAIYPTGSVMASVHDTFGNKIASFATPGLWNFVSSPGRHDVDNIRTEPYYGFAPKMDYEAVGNGFHNPAVRFASLTKDVKKAMGIPETHTTLWAPKRGGVSHGCSRLALGHVWEMRHIFPVENEKMMQVNYFGNNPQDFDIYDVKGDGQLAVMGVEYLISYNLAGTGAVAQREGADLQISEGKKLEFYRNLYGEKNVFNVTPNGGYTFTNPSTTMPSYLDYKKRSSSTRLTLNATLPLYEQTYEKDKVQFYVPTAHSSFLSAANPDFRRIARLMGRVRGCAPTSDKNQCGENAFDKEASDIIQGLGK